MNCQITNIEMKKSTSHFDKFFPLICLLCYLPILFIKQLFYQILGCSIYVSWPLNFLSQNLLGNEERILIKERRISYKHLIDKDTQRPPVHALVMASALNYLRGKVLLCAAQGGASLSDLLGETKVNDDHMTFFVQENVFRLEVSVDNIERVKVG